MEAESLTRGRTIKEVVVSGVDPNCDDEDAALDLALERAGESRSSLFGWSLTRTEDDMTRVVVTLHTD